MTDQPTPIDITGIPELLGIVEEVRRTKTPRILQRNSENVALVTPILIEDDPLSDPSARDVEAALAAGGSWKDLVDAQELKERIRAERGSRRAFPKQ